MAEEMMNNALTEEQEQELSLLLNDRINKLIADEQFMQQLAYTEEPEDVQKLFEQNGINISMDQVKLLGLIIERCIENNGELTEEDLEEVAGGTGPIAALGLVALALGPANFTGVIALGAAAVIGIGVAVYAVVKNARKIGDWFRRW